MVKGDPALGKGYRRDETPAEQLDRHWLELLQELRVTQTGIQILCGFLLTLPFQARFSELTGPLIAVFLVAVVLGALATCLVIAPVATHRTLFRARARDVLVVNADAMAKAGLAVLALTVVMVVTLVFGFVVDLTTGLIAGGVALMTFAILWLIVPVLLARRR